MPSALISFKLVQKKKLHIGDMTAGRLQSQRPGFVGGSHNKVSKAFMCMLQSFMYVALKYVFRLAVVHAFTVWPGLCYVQHSSLQVA